MWRCTPTKSPNSTAPILGLRAYEATRSVGASTTGSSPAAPPSPSFSTSEPSEEETSPLSISSLTFPSSSCTFPSPSPPSPLPNPSLGTPLPAASHGSTPSGGMPHNRPESSTCVLYTSHQVPSSISKVSADQRTTNINTHKQYNSSVTSLRGILGPTSFGTLPTSDVNVKQWVSYFG